MYSLPITTSLIFQIISTAPEEGWPIVYIPAAFVILILLVFIALFIYRHLKKSPSPFKSSLIDILVATVAIFIIATIADIFLILIDFDPFGLDNLYKKNGYYHLEPASERSKTVRGFFAHGVRIHQMNINGEPFWYYSGNLINSFGTRGPEPQKGRPDQRVIWIGDSVVFGSGVKWDDAFPKLVGDLQSKEFPNRNIEHINLAVPGYDVVRSRMALEMALKRLDADLIVFGLRYGDMNPVRLEGNKLVDSTVKVQDGITFIHTLPFKESEMAIWFERSHLLQLAAAIVGDIKAEPRYRSLDSFEKLEQDLEKLYELAVDHKVKLAFVLHNSLDLPFPSILERMNNPTQDDRAAYIRTVKKFIEKHKLPLFVVAEHLIDEDVTELRLDEFGHYNEKGHQVLARYLWPWISGLLQKK